VAGEQRDYIGWLHDQGCACDPCGAQDIQASHPRTIKQAAFGKRLAGRPGKGQRSDDRHAYPICSHHHGQIQRYEKAKPSSYFFNWTRDEIETWEREQGDKYWARYLEEQEQLKSGTLPEEKLVKALRRNGFDPKDFAARFCREYDLAPQIRLFLTRDLTRELKEGGVPL
jgi:hypothetical protein